MATLQSLLPSSGSCLALPRRPRHMTISASLPCKSTLAFSSTISSATAFTNTGGFGFGARGVVLKRQPLRWSVVCEAATTKKPDSAAKRARQNEKRRLRNKSRKSEMRTRMKKVFKALEVLRKKKDARPEELLPIEKLIAEAYKAIDKAVGCRALHKNTGAHRKSRLARRKKALEIRNGWYVPAPAATPDAAAAVAATPVAATA